jgi:iron complex outermembrane receptor protein
MKVSFALSAALFATTSLATPALAQDVEARTAEARSDEIVVTARRREETLARVPIAISALSGDALAKQGIRNESDLQSAVPGFLARETGNSAVLNLSIRGQSIDGFSSSPPAVLPYINEFQVSTSGGSAFFDLENVQVLKGPQGTLFGRNTTGGALLYTTKKPGNDFEGYLTARYGNLDSVGIQGGLTLPIVEDRLSLRVAGNYSDGGGFITNLGRYDYAPFVPANFTFAPDREKLGAIRTRSLRATIWASPLDNVENTTLVQYDAEDGTVAPSLVYSYALCNASNPAACAAAPFTSAIVTNGPFQSTNPLAQNIAWQRTTNRFTYSGASNEYRSRSILLTNTTKIALGDDLILKNIVGWNRKNRNYAINYDGSIFSFYKNPAFYADTVFAPGQRGAEHGRDNIFSEELQIQGKALDGKLDFIVGLYYANGRRLEDNYFQFYNGTIPPYRFRSRDRSYAGFAQATYDLTDQLHLTGGFRYTKDKIDGHQLPGGVFGPPATDPSFAMDQDMSFSNPSWNISLDYQITPELMVYLTQRGSWRAGGYNFPALPRDFDGTGVATAGNPLGLTGNVFRDETARDVELGVKFSGLIGGMRVTLNADIYNQWVKNVQRTAFVVVAGAPGLVTVNVPKAQITGQELAITLKPADWLSIGGQVSHTNARFTNGNVFAAGVLTPFTEYADVPDWSGAAFIEINRPLADGSSLTVRGDVFTQSGFSFANFHPVGGGDTRIPSYALVNGRIGWNDIAGSRVSAAVFAKNLFDEHYYAGGLATETSFGPNTVSPGRPRTFGAEISVKF